MISIYSLPMLLTVCVSASLLIFVAMQQSPRNFKIVFISLIAAITWWHGLWLILLNIDNPDLAVTLAYIGHIGIIMLPTLYYHTIALLLKSGQKYIPIYYALSGTCFALLVSGNLISGVHRYEWGYYPAAGPYHFIFLALCLKASLATLYHILIAQFTSVEKSKLTMSPLISLSLLSLSAVDFIPNYNINLYPFGIIPIMAGVFGLYLTFLSTNIYSSAQAQIKFKSFILYTLGTGSFNIVILIVALYIPNPKWAILLLFICMTTSIYVFPHIRILRYATISQFLFKEQIDIHKLMESYVTSVDRLDNKAEYMEHTVCFIAEILNLDKVCLVARINTDNHVANFPKSSFDPVAWVEGDFFEWLSLERYNTNFKHLDEHGEVGREFMSCFFDVSSKTSCFALLIGRSMSKSYLSQGEFELLHSLTTMMRITIRKFAKQESHKINEPIRAIDDTPCNQVKDRVKEDRSLLKGRRFPAGYLRLLNVLQAQDVTVGMSRELPITAMFYDIRSFTMISEKLSNRDTLGIINLISAITVPIIMNNEGIVDKFMGDGLMAIFERQESALNAVHHMIEALKNLNKVRQTQDRYPLKIGFGIHSGMGRVGVVGVEDQCEITVIGEVVNIASRLEQMNKKNNTILTVSDRVISGIDQKELEFKPIGYVPIPGSRKTIMAYCCETDIYAKDFDATQGFKETKLVV